MLPMTGSGETLGEPQLDTFHAAVCNQFSGGFIDFSIHILGPSGGGGIVALYVYDDDALHAVSYPDYLSAFRQKT